MRLEIIIKGGCIGADEACRLAKYMEEEFPALTVELIEWGGPRAVPKSVFATPTYLLDGAVVFLGNPSQSALAALVSAQSAVS